MADATTAGSTALVPRAFGRTGLTVSALGYGAGQIGDARLPDDDVERLLNTVLDAGVTLIDTARGYGLSEERIGRFLSHRRDAFVLSTKIGYGIEGLPDWTPETIRRGIEEARQRLQSDVLDIVHLHSCPAETLRSAGVVEALNEAVEAGTVRVAAYSGENDNLAYALESGAFGSLQTSLNVFDQRDIEGTVAEARTRGRGVIAKRPVGNAPWRFAERPNGHYAEVYWDRMRAMGLDLGADWQDVALRFAVYHTGAHACIVGTTNAAHLQQNVEIVKRGPLPEAMVAQLRTAFAPHAAAWDGQV
ncbi:MAG: aldo/keto reductase [Bacteroidota bacterium]